MVLIKEFIPNPAGKDTEGEWIKLFNNGDAGIDLSGWQIKDASGRAFIFSAGADSNNIISAGKILTLDYKITKISINNNGEALFLYDKNGALIDKAEYSGSAADGKIYIRAENGKFIASGGGDNNPSQNNLGNELGLAGLSASAQQESPDSQVVINNNPLIFNLFIGFSVALILASLFVLVFQKIGVLEDGQR